MTARARDAHASPRGEVPADGKAIDTDAGGTLQRRFPHAARAAFVAAAVALLALKLAYVFALEVNSDEPQHLHMLWGWTVGLLPYRDLFDNHAPAFALIWSPLLALFGERPDIVPLMRLTVLPLYGIALWLTWRIGAALWSRRVAAAAVAITAVCGPFFIVSTQFRADDLWATLWLATIAVSVSGALDARRGFVTGLLAGATTAVSLKTLPLLLTAGVASLLLAFAVSRSTRERASWRFAVALVAGVVVLPAAFALFFIANDAGGAMVYALFRHNLVGDLGRWQHDALRFILAPLTMPLALYLALRFRPQRADLAQWLRRSFVLLAAGGYLVVLYAYWPLFTRQDLLPAIPFVAMALALLLLRAGAGSHPQQRLRVAAVVLVVLAECVLLLVAYPIRTQRADRYEHLLARVLTLTTPHDYVLDAKGDSIFRHRPIYWVLEGITQARMRDGSIVDDIAARLAQTGTPVVLPERLPAPDRTFVADNYLAVDARIRVAGKRLGRASAGVPLRFTLALPQDYAVVDRDGAIDTMIDGTRCRPACRLGAGAHVLVTEQTGDIALAWAPALARGVAPAALLADNPVTR